MKTLLQIAKISAFFGLFLFMHPAFSQSKKKATWGEAASSWGEEERSDFSSSAIGAGFKRYTSTGGTALWALHGLYEIKKTWTVGAGFGFADDFDALIFSADLRKGFFRSGSSALFSEANAGFLKANRSHFIAGLRLGFEYALTEKLKLDASYGLELMLGNTNNHFGLSQPADFAGSFGIHWFF